MMDDRFVRVLVVTEQADPPGDLLEAIRARSESEAATFRVVVPNPARAEIHLLHPQRHAKALEAEIVLFDSLPKIEAAVGRRVIGSVSVRHDVMDAIEEIIYSEPVDEIMLSVAPHGVASWFHQDLPHRLRHLGLPVTVVGDNA